MFCCAVAISLFIVCIQLGMGAFLITLVDSLYNTCATDTDHGEQNREVCACSVCLGVCLLLFIELFALLRLGLGHRLLRVIAIKVAAFCCCDVNLQRIDCVWKKPFGSRFRMTVRTRVLPRSRTRTIITIQHQNPISHNNLTITDPVFQLCRQHYSSSCYRWRWSSFCASFSCCHRRPTLDQAHAAVSRSDAGTSVRCSAADCHWLGEAGWHEPLSPPRCNVSSSL